MSRRAWLALAMFLAAGLAGGRAFGYAGSEQPAIQINVNYWAASYLGELELGEIDIMGATVVNLGQTLDLTETLGIVNPRWVPEIEARIKLGEGNQVILAWSRSEYNGERRLDANVEFAGFQFPVATKFESQFKFDRYKLVDQWNIPLESDAVEIGFQAGVEYFAWGYTFKGTEQTTGLSVEREVKLYMPYPVVGIAGSVAFGGGFGAQVAFSGMAAGVLGYKSSFTDLDAGLYWHFQNFHLGASYRSLRLLADGEKSNGLDFRFDLIQSGALITAGFFF